MMVGSMHITHKNIMHLVHRQCGLGQQPGILWLSGWKVGRTGKPMACRWHPGGTPYTPVMPETVWINGKFVGRDEARVSAFVNATQDDEPDKRKIFEALIRLAAASAAAARCLLGDLAFEAPDTPSMEQN